MPALSRLARFMRSRVPGSGTLLVLTQALALAAFSSVPVQAQQLQPLKVGYLRAYSTLTLMHAAQKTTSGRMGWMWN